MEVLWCGSGVNPKDSFTVCWSAGPNQRMYLLTSRCASSRTSLPRTEARVSTGDYVIVYWRTVYSESFYRTVTTCIPIIAWLLLLCVVGWSKRLMRERHSVEASASMADVLVSTALARAPAKRSSQSSTVFCGARCDNTSAFPLGDDRRHACRFG